MHKVSQKDIDWLLQPAERFELAQSSSFTRSVTSASKKIGVIRWLLGISAFTFSLVILPFFILIRTAVYLNISEQINGWLALLGGMVASIVFISLVLFFVLRKLNNRHTVYRIAGCATTLLVTGFTVYGLLYLNSVNAKTEEVRNVYRTLHPILRVAVATTTLAESDLVITDIQRSPDDYQAMGLTPREHSFHYPQPTGFVHAIDLRTIGHSEFRNTLLEYTLKLMGFQTIRHVGTADHLHVALPFSP